MNTPDFSSITLARQSAELLAKSDSTNPLPTPAQAEAGNYKKRKLQWNSLTISIENEPGSVRKGNGWKTKMLYAYGYINSTLASDGDQIDVYIGSDESADMVYVIHQRKYGDWARYDEDKCMLQFSSEAAARAAYLKHYDDPRFLGPITAMPVDEFVEKARNANGRMVKAITLIFPNGNEHEVFQGDYSFNNDDEMLKAEMAAGQRWITVHPNGSGSKGVPLMVQEAKHGSGVFHVIGGAGGKLNYLKLRGLKPESSYKEQAAENAKSRREGKKQQASRDKELGIGESKKKAHESIQTQKHKAADAFIKKVADKMGWKPEDLEPHIQENVSEITRSKLVQKHQGELLKRANAAVELQHQNLITDAQAREEALGKTVEATESTPAHKLDVSDLDDSRPASASSLGFSAHYAERAAEHGATDEVVSQEAAAKKDARQANLSEGQRAAIKTRGDTALQVKSEIANIREPITSNVKAVLASARDAVEMIKAQKEFKATLKAASLAGKEIDDATAEVKAYNLEVSAPDDADIAEGIENDLRTIRTKAFLSAVDKEVSDPEKALRQHVSAGAFNSINALALTAGGAALIDRSVVDVLGIEGAAQVLARRLHSDMPEDEMVKLTDGMEAFHLHHYMETSKDAMQEAKELHDAAKEIQLGEASHGGDFEAAREMLHRRNACVEKAHQILGTALGEMEANAALVTALKGGRSDKPMEVPLGKMSDEDAIRQVRAIGLQRGDYQIDRVAGNQVLTITPEGLDRLAKPVDREELERTRNTLDILNGGQDEDDWLPQGFAKRPDLALNLKPGVAAALARPFKPSGDMRQSIKDYIGGRAADGDSPDAIVEDLQSADFFQKSGNAQGYREALDDVAARTGEDGKLLRNEDLAESFNQYADEYVAREYGGKVSPIQRQNFEPDAVAQDALHRALSDTPEGMAAYKQIGELSNKDVQIIHKFFKAEVAHESAEASEMRERLESMQHTEPEKEVNDMFGVAVENPDWTAWGAQNKELSAHIKDQSLSWETYADKMGGPVNAYATIQDMIKSKVGAAFNEHYNKLNPNAPLKLGRQVVRNNLNHLDAVDPKARADREKKERELIDGLRERSQGKYASGSVSDKLDAAREEQEAFNQSQMGFFSTEQDDMFGGGATSNAEDKPVKPLASDERHTLGHAAERTIAGMMGVVGQNFKAGQPLKIFSPTMSGPDGVMRQRAIKIIAQNKRVALAAGTGAGKTAMMLGAFSHLQSQGKSGRGLFLVPSIVQGQMGAEALRFMEPGKYNWHCEPGATRDERIAAYKDPKHHFTVMTHQSFRDDMLHLGAQHAGLDHAAMTEKLESMKPEERSAWMKGVLEKEGINYNFLAGDEAHNTLNRDGKANSAMANVIDAVSANTEYYVHASADVVKNDLSEAADVMRKMDPKRYGDTNAFMRRYGVNTQGAKEALKRELIRHVLPFKLEPKVRADKKEISVTPTEAQNKALAALDKNIGRVRMARMEGKTDMEAMKAISPSSFKDAPEGQHEAIAKELAQSIGIMKGAAVRAILDSSPESAKIDALASIANERKGKPGVVFAHSLEAVENIRARLEKDGHRVMTLTGSDSSADKSAKIRGFNPDKGDRTHDIMVASDAGATGANLQSGQWLTQFDSPMTAMTHAQRNGRINRIGQKNDVELMDLVADHTSERNARERLKTKYALRELMSSSMEGLDDTGLASFLHQRKVTQQQESMF
jgi:superfamily II DNA or RNA helicase